VTTQATIPKDIEKSNESRTSIGSATRIDMPLPNAAADSAIIALRTTKLSDRPDDIEFIRYSFYKTKHDMPMCRLSNQADFMLRLCEASAYQ